MESKSKVFEEFYSRGFLPSPEVLESFDDSKTRFLDLLSKEGSKEKLVVIAKEWLSDTFVTQQIDWSALEKLKFLSDKGKHRPYNKAIQSLIVEKHKDIIIEKAYTKKPTKRSFEHFSAYYISRYRFLSNILRTRDDTTTYSISRVLKSKPEGLISIIGMVMNKTKTRNKNLILTLDDPTGSIKAIIMSSNAELFSQADDTCLDEVLLVTGYLMKSNVLVASKLSRPSIIEKPLTKVDKEQYIAFIGDTHFGSKLFLKQEFSNFLRWINQETGTEQQKEIASKVRWVVITGDLVEGVGIYPGQENELIIKDIYEQYNEAARWLSRIPKNIDIIIIPGNHDAVRIEEPQPPILKKYAQSVYELENVYLLPNPVWLRLGGSKGLLVLLYHGFSIPYYADEIERIRQLGGQKRVELVMQYLLERRHLAPSHNSNLYIPDPEEDPLLITKIPDLFVTGHIHRVSATNYKGVTLINSSCWTGKSKDQERRGLEPQPGRVILVNTKTRDIKILNFSQS